MQLGVVADDVTGGTDVGSVLRRAGLTVVQTIDLPAGRVPPAEAIVVSLKTRTAPAAEASRLARAAAAWLIGAGAERLYFKYCSTFDSTDEGNIGPVIETLLEEIRVPLTVACPAYPAQGRTVYQGHLFVGDALLSDSPMRHHPLTPMIDSNLVRVLARQCRARVGLVPLADVDAGVAAVRARCQALAAAGHRVAILDGVLDRHLDILGAACPDLRLATGGAALAGALARSLAERSAPTGGEAPVRTVSSPLAILSGSCSAATAEQVAHLATLIPARALDPVVLVEKPQALNHVLDWVADQVIRRRHVLVFSSARPESVRRAHARLGRPRAAAVLEDAFRQIAAVLAEAGVRTFVVAGGETAGAVLQALNVRMLGFACELDRGVPWTYSLDPEGFTLALKSGNFGTRDVFSRALQVVA